MTDFLTRLTELAGADVTAKLVAEWGGQQPYFPRPATPYAAPDGCSCNSALAASCDAISTDDLENQVVWARQQAQLQLDEAFKQRMGMITKELLCSSGEDHRAWKAEAQLCCQLFLDACSLFSQSLLAASPQSTQS